MALNNPFNIRANDNNHWLGKVTKPHSTFEQFDTLEHGVRAGLIVLANYHNNYDCDSVSHFITRFAPPLENPTLDYIHYVEDYLQSKGFFYFSLPRYDAYEKELFFCCMAYAMIKFEGTCYVSKITLGFVRDVFRKFKILSRIHFS